MALSNPSSRIATRIETCRSFAPKWAKHQSQRVPLSSPAIRCKLEQEMTQITLEKKTAMPRFRFGNLRTLPTDIALLYAPPAGFLVALAWADHGSDTFNPLADFSVMLLVTACVLIYAKLSPPWSAPAVHSAVLACELTILYPYIAYLVKFAKVADSTADAIGYTGLAVAVFLAFGAFCASDNRKGRIRRGVAIALFAPVSIVLITTAVFAYTHDCKVLGRVMAVFFVLPCCLQLLAMFIQKEHNLMTREPLMHNNESPLGQQEHLK